MCLIKKDGVGGGRGPNLMAEQTTRIAFSTSGILGKKQILVVCELFPTYKGLQGRKSCPGLEAASKTFTSNERKNFPRENEFTNPTNIYQLPFIFHFTKTIHVMNVTIGESRAFAFREREVVRAPGSVFLSK